ncbi:thioesterase family protein [Microbacterium sp. KR10-403]|uniref:thioesterase family protein n=1 Tax=Microbacterium sp. KR10-403 TaxID=3158581 RepID=UPI0032E4C9A9
MREVPAGLCSTIDVVVSREMTVDFDELGPVHPVYATYWIAKHMEEVSRKLILPFLDHGEEGIGHSVTVKHFNSAPVGMRVTITATLVATTANRIVSECRAMSELGDVIAEGGTEQVVLPSEVIQRRFDRVRAQLAEASQARAVRS